MKKPSAARYAGVGAAVLGVTGALASFGVSAASAAPSTYITVVGSNTTQEVMGAVVSAFNAKNTAIQATNVYAQPADPGTTAPSDANCNGGTAITYISEANPGTNQRTAPNGSGAGRKALEASVTNGDSCVSVARSSSPPVQSGTSADPAGTQAYAYATDAVTWSAESGGAAPANFNLTMTDLENIYNCTYTNWDQVGGANAPIDLYYPQSGSGSGSFFAGVLGFDPRTSTTCVPTQIEENEATSIPQANAADAIMIYSAGSWVAQANGADADMRNGFSLGSINETKFKPITGSGPYKLNATVVGEKNVEPAAYKVGNDTAIQGVRNLFNFVNSSSVDYTAAEALVGTKSALCTGKDKSLVTKYGFNPLSKCVFFNY